jgi:hypothetical protein
LSEAPPGPPAPPVTLPQIEISTPQAQTRQVAPGDRVAFTIPVDLPAGTLQLLEDATLAVGLDLLDPQGRQAVGRQFQDMSVSEGRNNLARSVSISRDAPAGQYALGVSLWDRRPVFGGRQLVQRTFSNVFEVAARVPPVDPTPPPPVLAPQPTPAPTPTAEPIGPVAPRLIPVSSPTLTPSTVVQGQMLTGSWTLRNPLAQRLRAYLFIEGPAGVRSNGVPRDFDPAESNTIRVIERVPLNTPRGSAVYRLEVRDANTQRLIGNLRLTFTITVQAEPEPEPATPPEPAAGGFIGGNISLVAVGPVTPSVEAGETIQIQYTLRNNSTRRGTVELQIFGRDPGGNTRGTGRGTATLEPMSTANPRVSLAVPASAPPEVYGVRVFIWDPRTFVAGDPSTFLVQRTDAPVFTVRS